MILETKESLVTRLRRGHITYVQILDQVEKNLTAYATEHAARLTNPPEARTSISARETQEYWRGYQAALKSVFETLRMVL